MVETHPLLNEVERLCGGRRVVVVLLGDGGLHAVPDDVGVGRLLEVDEHAERDLGQEDDHQEEEKLQNLGMPYTG